MDIVIYEIMQLEDKQKEIETARYVNIDTCI